MKRVWRERCECAHGTVAGPEFKPPTATPAREQQLARGAEGGGVVQVLEHRGDTCEYSPNGLPSSGEASTLFVSSIVAAQCLLLPSPPFMRDLQSMDVMHSPPPWR